MRKKLILILLALAAIAAAFLASSARVYINWPTYQRTYQHIVSQQPQDVGAGADGFVSHLPLVLIETGGIVIEQDVKKPVTISVIDNTGGNNRPEDEPALTTASLINIRGNTSTFFEKKQYRLNFVKSMDSESRVAREVMGMPRESDWVLNGPCLDKTLMRNYMMYNLAGEIMAWSPHVRFCEVFMDGQYQGVYVMIEAVTVDKHRVDVARDTNARGEVGYLLLRDIPGKTKTPIEGDAVHTSYELGIEFPNPDNLTGENLRYITESIQGFENDLYAPEDGQEARAYADDIDLYSFVDYFIFNEFTMNRDAGVFSTYSYRDPRGKLTMGPVWDFNNSFDNHIDKTPYDMLIMAERNWYSELVEDDVFVSAVIRRYAQLRKTVLNEARLLQMVDEIAAYLGPAIDRNNERWQHLADSTYTVWSAEVYCPEGIPYEQAIQQLKDMIVTKGRYLDENLAPLLRQYVETEP